MMESSSTFHQPLWLSLSGTAVVIVLACGGFCANGYFRAPTDRPFDFWVNPASIVAYFFLPVAILAFAAAVRGLHFPFTGSPAHDGDMDKAKASDNTDQSIWPDTGLTEQVVRGGMGILLSEGEHRQSRKFVALLAQPWRGCSQELIGSQQSVSLQKI